MTVPLFDEFDEHQGATMIHAERKALREKHRASTHKTLCTVCREEDGYPASYPCDVIKVLDYLDLVEPMPTEINGKAEAV